MRIVFYLVISLSYFRERKFQMQIRVNTDELAFCGEYLLSKSEEYEKVVMEIYARMQQLQSIWQGSDHQAFMQQLEQFRPQLIQLHNVMSAYAQYLYKSAMQYQQVQNERIVKVRSLA